MKIGDEKWKLIFDNDTKWILKHILDGDLVTESSEELET